VAVTKELRIMAEARIAVIPARGGSKRVPKKNIKQMRGKPLIAYTIEAARQSNLFERIVVSTESQEIADIACQYGAEIPFLRDPALADDYTPVSAATVDMVSRLDPAGTVYEYVCQLMPNCPLRTAADILDSYRQLSDSGAGSQLSVVRYGWQNPWWAMKRTDEFVLEPVFSDYLTKRSQDLPALFCPTGAVWWAKAEVLRREGTYHISDRTGWEMPWQNGLDIDTEDDWNMAEILLVMSPSRIEK
jgi:CMP-N-acetylneuraminic acid synthetase